MSAREERVERLARRLYATTRDTAAREAADLLVRLGGALEEEGACQLPKPCMLCEAKRRAALAKLVEMER